MKNNQNKLDLAELTQEQIKHILNIWDCNLNYLTDIEDRLKNTRDYLCDFDCKDIFKFKLIDDNDLGTLVFEKSLFYSASNFYLKESVNKVKKVFQLLEENGFSLIKDLSQTNKKRWERHIVNRLSELADKRYKASVIYEKRLLEFIEIAGLFQNLSEKRTLDFAKNVVTSNSTHLLEWLFSRGLSPDTMIEENKLDTFSQENKVDKSPLVSFSRTIRMLNVFISHGANLTLTSEDGVALSDLLYFRLNSLDPLFIDVDNKDKIIHAVRKVESKVNPQEWLWMQIKDFQSLKYTVHAIKNYVKAAHNLRDLNGCHIVQYAMLHSPYLVNTILSINKKTLALSSTPDEYGRLPSVYWIADQFAQKNIRETDKTTLIIPKQINKEAWNQAAEIAYKFDLNSIGLFSNEVERMFKKTTGKKLDEWIEEDAANGNPLFERMLDLAVKRTEKKKHNKTPVEDLLQFSDVIKIWADPDNPRVINKAHALFRAHLILDFFVIQNQYSYPFYISNEPRSEDQIKNQTEQTQKIKHFFKTQFSGKTFDILKNQINNGVSLMRNSISVNLAESQWWHETCAAIEREMLLKEQVKVTKTATHSKFVAL